MAASRSYLLYLEDMQQAMERIARYCTDLNFEQFCANELVADAVVRNIEVIGEAAKKIPPQVQQLYPNYILSFPGRRCIECATAFPMRNRISHEYFGLDYSVIWRVVTQHLPVNYQDLLVVIAAERVRPL